MKKAKTAKTSQPRKNRLKKKARKVYKRQFRHQWLDDPEFKDWLVRPRPEEKASQGHVGRLLFDGTVNQFNTRGHF
jgi:hypothetical protein